MKVITQSFGDKLCRTATVSSVSMSLPPLKQIVGQLSDSEKREIAEVESAFFSLGEKMTIKNLSLTKVMKSKEPLPVSTITKPKSDPQPASSPGEKPDEKSKSIPKDQPDASKLTLQKVGDSVEGQFKSFGNRYFGSSNHPAAVIYVYVDRELIFIRGSNFSEHKANRGITAGDIIRITKVAQYKAAADKSNAQAARYEIEILEKIGEE